MNGLGGGESGLGGVELEQLHGWELQKMRMIYFNNCTNNNNYMKSKDGLGGNYYCYYRTRIVVIVSE